MECHVPLVHCSTVISHAVAPLTTHRYLSEQQALRSHSVPGTLSVSEGRSRYTLQTIWLRLQIGIGSRFGS